MGEPNHQRGAVFEAVASDYDAWYDTARGRALFGAEIECLRPFVDLMGLPRLEAGVGTGRFATALDIEYGVDPAPAQLELAASHGIKVTRGAVERLPYGGAAFGGVLMVFTLCFVDDAQQALREAWRVLRPRGNIVLGTIPRGTPWGDEYERRAREGHPLYSTARFHTIPEIKRLLAVAGFGDLRFRSTLFTPPDGWSDTVAAGGAEKPVDGLRPDAGFVAISASKTGVPPHGR